MSNSYAQFWTLLARMVGDKEELKDSLVYEFSEGRTVHLHEMTVAEYSKMVDAMSSRVSLRRYSYAELRRSRSAVLHQMQVMGIDTTDWEAVDRFCLDARIAGVMFRQLNIEQLEAVAVKCRAIRLKAQNSPDYQLN